MKVNPETPVWWRDNVLFDPVMAAAQLPCPVLMVHPENDYLVTREVDAAHRAMKKRGKKDVELKVLPGLNHRFVPATSRREAYLFDKASILTRPDTTYPLDSAVVTTVTGWLKIHLAGR